MDSVRIESETVTRKGHKSFSSGLQHSLLRKKKEVVASFHSKPMQGQHSRTKRANHHNQAIVSNYHLLGYPSIQCPQKRKTPNVGLHEHIATPEQKLYIPVSPCLCDIRIQTAAGRRPLLGIEVFTSGETMAPVSKAPAAEVSKL